MVGSLDRTRWYWTPTKLNALVATLEEISRVDRKGLYFGPEPLNRSACDANPVHFRDAFSKMSLGIEILVFLGLLEEGKRGTKRSGYKRRFYPDAMKRSIQWKDIERFREARDRKQYSWKYRE